MRLTPDVALIAGGPLTGFGLSADFDAHVYLLDGGDELALIDCGLGTEAGQAALLGRVAELGLDPSRIRRLFVTHYHADHAGGAGRYRARLGLSVAAAAEVAGALATADGEATSFRSASALGFFPPAYDYAPCPVDDALEDGDVRAVGRLSVRAIATPGHCAGHTSYLVTGGERTYLLAGDALFAGGRILLQAIPDCDLGASLASIRRLADVTFDALLPGHGSIALTGGGAHAAAAVAAMDRLAVPVGLV
jgi:glyoxylase-like metal-dependent hydrolase (beta-lactamase superfamily II)